MKVEIELEDYSKEEGLKCEKDTKSTVFFS